MKSRKTLGEKLKDLRAESDLRLTDDYDTYAPSEPILPPWKVYFEGRFWNEHGKSRAGIEVPVEVRFQWNGQEVFVPSVYSCAKGLVVDICIRISAEAIRAFIEKWDLSPENDGSDFTEEQRMQVEAESPLTISFSPEVTVNGRALQFSHGIGLSYNPCVPDGNALETQEVMKHYNLNPECGWVVSRHAFPWATSRRPKAIKTLNITLMADAVPLPGSVFKASAPGTQIAFIHPISGKSHTLTVLECEKHEMLEQNIGDDTLEFPTHYTTMNYTVMPALPDGTFSVMDAVQSDRPKKKQIDPTEPASECAAMSVGIIGGADGPTAIFIGGKPRVACSSLHFGSEYDVRWQMIFHEKTYPNINAKLI